MTIEPKDLLIYKSQVNLDTDDGGGAYSGQILIDGQSNNLFPDVSELDRTVGRVSLRKVFPAVDTPDTDALMGATVIISENPVDPSVSALLFSTENWVDRRSDAQNRIEQYLAKGAMAVGSLLDTAYEGMKAIQVAMDKTETENSVGDTLVLVSNEGLSNEQQQFIRLTAVEVRTATVRVGGTNIEYKLATYSFNDALEQDFVGVSAAQWYNNIKPVTLIRETLVADSGKYYASQPLTVDVSSGSFSVNVASIFAQLIPSAQVESPLLDLNASGMSVALVAANEDAITIAVTTTVNNAQSLYLGSSILPGSITFTLFGQAISDNGGTLRTASGTQVGTIDYQTGHIVWTNAIGSGNTSFNVSFIPAAAPVQPFQSYAVPVTQNNQGNNWTGTLIPIPAPGALSISYMSQGKFYVLRDNGTGKLVGGNQSFGTGTINYQTGTWLLTTGVLPSVGTPILLQWASPISTFARADLPVAPAGLDFTLFHNGIVSATVTWLLDGVTKTATANSSGQLSGDATGYIRFNDGTGRIIPSKLPQKNTVFTITYDYGTGKDQTVSSGTATAKQYSFTIGTGAAIKPGSVGLDIPVNESVDSSFTAPYGSIALLHDVPVNSTTGNLVDQTGVVQGTITYATGAVVVRPTTIGRTYQRPVYSTLPVFDGTGFYNTTVVSTFESAQKAHEAYLAVTVAVRYRDTSGTGSSSKTVNADKLVFDLTQGFDEQILTGSVRFKLGSDVVIDNTGLLYRNVDPVTGSGIQSGTIQYGTGLVQLDSWTPNADNVLTIQGLATTTDLPPINHISFRTSTTPIRPGSLTVVVAPLTGGTITLNANDAGVISTANAHGSINYETGFIDIAFYTKTKFTIGNRADIESQQWYDVSMEYAQGGDTYINVPYWIAADSVRYNAIAYTYIPLDADILGLSATRLPPDGRVPVFRVGDIGVISSSKLQTLSSHVAGQMYQLNDVRLSWVELEDAAGAKVDYDLYTVDYDNGRVTLSGDFAMGSLTNPIKARYRYQDMGLINDVQISGQITFTKPVTHNYDNADSIVASALVIGDMQARYTAKFVQSTWNNVWNDTATGAPLSANYNDALYPLLVTNRGAIEERWAIVFTDTTVFRVVGEYSGQIATGTTTTDCQPINPVTGAPYFKIKKEGWGSGWVSGNVLRFNTKAATYPVWVIRTVKQSEPTVMSDQFQIQIRGDIDRVM